MSAKTSWGGDWTEKKLDAFEKYVNAYLTIMNKHRDKSQWQLIYFDAFAGSGTRDNKENNISQIQLFDLPEKEINLYKGAAERVLNISQRGFEFYYFIDKSKEANDKLKKKLSQYKDKGRLEFRNGDANQQIQELANAMHKDKKLVTLALLDPFGMQIDWSVIEQLKGTHTDLWILIPTGVIVNRLIDKNGTFFEKNIGKLKDFFGLSENEIREYFYTQSQQQTLFGEEQKTLKCEQTIKKIAELYIERLKTIFKEVTDKPLELKNTKGLPIYHFAFASNNETAKKIAKDIIR